MFPDMADRATIFVVSAQHSFLGAIENRGLRVLEILNDLSSDYLDLHDVAVFRGLQGECVKRLPAATLPKSMVDFVLLESHKHEAPLRRTHAYVAKDSHNAFMLLGDFEIHGELTIKWTPNSIRYLQQEQTAFFPVAKPQVMRFNGSESPISAGTALVNGLKITLLDMDRRLASSTH
jgi:hypothetical protein